MDRFVSRAQVRFLALLIGLGFVSTTTGCVHRILATMVYVWSGPTVEAEFDGLEGARLVVVCRPPSSLEYRHAGAARRIEKGVGALLNMNVEDIDVVDSQEVDNWHDESDHEDFRELAKALDADRVLHIELQDFKLNKGPSLYQGNADVILSIYDMRDNGRMVWEKPVGQVLFPVNSAVPALEKSEAHFQRQFISVLSERIARHFYDHDPHFDFAIDATAHR